MPDDSNSSQDDLSKEFDEIIVRTKSNTPPEPAPVIADPLPDVREETRPEVVAPTVAPVVVAPAPVAAVSEPATPAEVTAAPAPVVSHVNTPGVLVMQWLAYAFWGWFAVAMLWMSIITFGYLVDLAGIGSDIGEVVAYPIAALVVLAVIAIVVDLIYARHEPAKKTGAATVIMVIHAVLFALLGIASLISIVFAVVNMSLNSSITSGSDGAQVTLYTGAVMLVIYALLTVRVVYGKRIAHVRKITWAVLLVLGAGIAIAGLLGPVARAAQSKQDLLIERALPSVPSAVEEYVQTNNKLPANLDDTLQYASSYQSKEMTELISQDLVRYKPNSKPADMTGSGAVQLNPDYRSPGVKSTTSSSFQPGTYTEYYYQLCVTYKFENNGYSYDRYSDDYESNYISTSSHPAGEKCYNLKTSSY